MTYIITEPCEGECNTACVEVCPVDCIYPPDGFSFSRKDKVKMKNVNEQLYIHPEECIDCGACQPECPVEAIFPDDEVPEKWKHFIDKNYFRFGLKMNEEPLD
jgi:NAD-dependent dihydropyrimidine dehydrogenase PreA subunit